MVVAVNRGTAAAARSKLNNLAVAGKTGTTSDYRRDNWFAGFSGSHVAVVWVGYDDNASTGLSSASSAALPVWAQVMSSIETMPWEQPLPDGISGKP